MRGADLDRLLDDLDGALVPCGGLAQAASLRDPRRRTSPSRGTVLRTWRRRARRRC